MKSERPFWSTFIAEAASMVDDVLTNKVAAIEHSLDRLGDEARGFR